MLDEKQQTFLDLASEYERLSEKLEVMRLALEQAMMDLGIDTYVQDQNTLAVYKIIEPNGTFMYYRKIGYKRTNIEGEKGGGGTVLSKKEAEEAGFSLKR